MPTDATIRSFAERVLFTTSLDEKLAPPPATIRDDSRGAAIATPETPGRPDSLRMLPGGPRPSERRPPPGLADIADDAQRGRLLHFFANHELLATELMALVLLKFPDAPTAFRAGVLRTLKDEQRHTKLYLRRMAECGVRFGDLPVNGFFWNAVSPMASPMDYVAGLSLTFEQANLDFARGYAEAFAAAGDPATAALLDRIYRDEIGHVGYGLEWFRRWKEDPGASDWDAYRHRLALPLSAARAKGNFAFNEEGRRAAGLTPEFIRELRVYSQSKGRTPNVYSFNPNAEASIAQRSPAAHGRRPSGFQATDHVARDLAMLPAFLARAEDICVVPEIPPTPHLESLQRAGLALPEFVTTSELPAILATRKINSLRPWAHTPDALTPTATPTPTALFSKLEHARFLAPIAPDHSVVGRPAGTIAEVETHLRAFATFPHTVFKAPFSTAGRDRLLHDNSTPLTPAESTWLQRTIDAQSAVLVEPWLPRMFDFSIQYDSLPDGTLARRALVHLANSAKGQFRSVTAPARFTDSLPEEIRRSIYTGAPTKHGHLLHYLDEFLEPALRNLLAHHCYRGPLGVDAFYYRTADGAIALKPVSEINPRYTMGRIAHELARFSPGNRATTLTILPTSTPAPPGSIALTPVAPTTRFTAYLTR